MSEAEGILSDLSEEELDLTVEEFLNKKCDKSIKEVEAAAEEMVKEIQNEHKQRVEEIKKKIREWNMKRNDSFEQRKKKGKR